MTIKRVTPEQAKKLQGTTDWCRADAMEDKRIDEAAKSDPDSALPTPEELKQFRRVAGKNAKKEKP